MNTALAVEEILDGNDIFSVYDALTEMGMSAKDYKPLASGMYFFWDKDLNRILYVEAETMTVVAPKEYKGQQYNSSKT